MLLKTVKSKKANAQSTTWSEQTEPHQHHALGMLSHFSSVEVTVKLISMPSQ